MTDVAPQSLEMVRGRAAAAGCVPGGTLREPWREAAAVPPRAVRDSEGDDAAFRDRALQRWEWEGGAGP